MISSITVVLYCMPAGTVCIMISSWVVILVELLLVLNIDGTPHKVGHASCDDARTEPGHPDRILYNKVPKCGSTTLEMMFNKVGNLTGMNVVLQHFLHGSRIDIEQQREFVEDFSNLTVGTLFHRHLFLPDFHRFDEEYPALINIIRDPVNRLISGFYYMKDWHKIRQDIPSKFIDMDLDECVRRRIPMCVRKVGALPFFCGQDKICRQPSAEGLARAKYHVCRYYDTVGITEDMRAFVEVLEHLYPNLMSGIVDIYDNTADRLHEYTSTKTRKEPNAETLAVLKQALHYEYDFYYFVRERFYRQYDTIKNKFKK